MMLFQCSWTTVTLISACKELMLDVFSSIGEDVMVGVGCTARRDARNSDLLKIDEIDPTYAWTLPPAAAARPALGRRPRALMPNLSASRSVCLSLRSQTPCLWLLTQGREAARRAHLHTT